MPQNPDIRASDADRDRVAAALREHSAEGRITMDELQERLDATYAAKTIGDLQAITADLPEEDLHVHPIPATQKTHTPPARSHTKDLHRFGAVAAWGSWASVSLMCFVVWAIVAVTSGATYPWFLWVAGPWGAMILLSTILGPKRR
jgi:hypothetical protein